MEGAGKVTRGMLFWVGMRSFLLQAAWNFERMQNLGWAYCLRRVLNRLYADPVARAQAIRRHLEFFNTHPYLAGPILGYAIRVEEKVAAGEGASAAEVTALKMGMMGTLAALGDNFFWATLRPLTALMGVSLVLFARGDACATVGGPVLFLVAFNLPHLLIRFFGLFQGYYAGPEVVTFLRRLNVQRAVQMMQLFGLVMVGGLFAAFDKVAVLHDGRGPLPVESFLYLVIGAILFFLLRRKVSPTRIFLTVMALCIIAGFLHQALFWRTP